MSTIIKRGTPAAFRSGTSATVTYASGQTLTSTYTGTLYGAFTDTQPLKTYVVYEPHHPTAVREFTTGKRLIIWEP